MRPHAISPIRDAEDADASAPREWSTARVVVVALLVAVGCGIGAAAGTRFVFPGVGSAFLFAPYAVLAAALMLAPMRVWWILVVASSVGNFWPHQGFERSLTFVLMAETANISRALMAAGGVRWLSRRPSFETLHDTSVFVMFAAALGPAVGASIGAAAVVSRNPDAEFWVTWQTWLLSNTLTGLTLLPLLLIVAQSRLGWVKRASLWRIVEACAMSLGLLVVGLRVFVGSSSGTSVPASLYAPLPFLLWAAVRFGPVGTIVALSVTTALTIFGAAAGRGPFVGQAPDENLLQLQFFLIAATLPILFLAATVRQNARATAALSESQRQYQSVVEDQTELICRLLPDGTYTFVNGAYCRYFQRTSEQLLGRQFWAFLPADSHEPLRQKLASLTPDRPVLTAEHEVLAPGGEIRWQQWTDRAFFSADGRIVAYQAVGRDITERKRFEQALRESEDQVRLFVQHAPAAVAMFDRDLNYIIYSQRWLKDYNLGDQSLVGRCHYEVFPEVPDRWKEIHRRCLAGAVETCDEDMFVRLDGSVDWIHWEVRPWLHADGSVGGIIMFTEVITQRKLAEDEHRQLESQRHVEKALRASEERFRSLADNAPVLIWRTGLNNEGVYFNKPWLDFTGRALEQELGLGWLASIHPDDRDRCAAVCNAAFARREAVSLQFRLRRHDGSYRWILDNGTPYYAADGAFGGYIGSCVDITERHLAELALQEAGRRKDEFLAMLGHELRNPLAPIGMALEIMRAGAASDDPNAWARDVISRQLQQLTRLVDDLLDVSRITRGAIKLETLPLDLGRVIAQAVETSHPLIVARQHALSIDVPKQPLPLRGDAVRLAQVVSNLLNNAAKYTEAGGRIDIVARRLGASAVLTIKDNGMGIPDVMLERVFDMFTQVDTATGRSQGGLGIGLTLVKRLVEMHGGTVVARSDGPGRGTEFTVTLPLAIGVGPDARVRDGEQSSRALRHEAVPKRILIVDDNVDAARTLSAMLRMQEHEVVVAHDGPGALSAADRLHPDIVLLDIGMSEMDGLEVARRLRHTNNGSMPLLVATTGFGSPEDRRRIAEAGFDHHLIKPLDPDALRSIVRKGRGP